jgi:4-amino-4-deoxy-L-arabinose transferase-like glycosyltransferase
MSATEPVSRRPSRDALVFVLLFLLAFVPRAVDLGADPPNNLSIDSGGEYGDPGNYAFNARNKAVFGDAKIDELGAAAFSPIPHAAVYLSFLIFGTGMWQMNLVPLLFAMGLWLAVARLASRWFRGARILILALLSLNHAFGSFARINDQVMPMAFFGVVALIFFLEAWDKPRSFFWTSVFLGLSFLSKGKMIYFSAGVIPLAFILITIQRGEGKRVRLLLVRLGFALAGLLVVVIPWYVLIYAPHPKIFESIASINANAATPRSIGGFLKNWLVRPALTFAPANAALAAPLFFYVVGLLAAVTTGRWRRRLQPAEMVCALWFIAGVGLNSSITYRPIRHYIELTIPLIVLAALTLHRLAGGIEAALVKRGRAAFLVGSFFLFWASLSSTKTGPLAWAGIGRDPMSALVISLVLAAGLAFALGLALLAAGERTVRIPRTAGLALALLVGGFYAGQNAAAIAAWRSSAGHDLRNVGRQLGQAFPEAAYAGLLIPTLSLENRNPAHTMFPHYANYDPQFLDRARITHLFLGSYNNERQYYDQLFPDVMERARILVIYRMWRSWWTLWDIRPGLPPEEPAAREIEAMERNEGFPTVDPDAGGRFAVRVASPDWGVVAMDKLGFPEEGRMRGRLYVRADAEAPPDAILALRLSLKGRTVLEKRIAVPRTTGGRYAPLVFEAWIGAPGSYLLEIKAAGTGVFYLDRIAFRPASAD